MTAHALGGTPFIRAIAAVLYYRSLPVGEDLEAAAVAADALEEAGLHTDAAWYRIAAKIQPPYPRPEGQPHVFNVATNLLPEVAPVHRVGGAEGDGR